MLKNIKIVGLTLVMSFLMVACGGASSTSTNAGGARTLGPNEEAATIPASIATTYNLTYNETNAGAGITNGSTATFVVGTDGSLTINGTTTLTDPYLYRGNTQEAIWLDNTNNLAYSLSSLTLGFNEINVSNNLNYDDTGFQFYGQYR